MSAPLNDRSLGEGSNLQDRITFPTLGDCPQLGAFDEVRYDTNGRTIRHWCFLGEITKVVNYTRVVFEVKDMTGREEARIACYGHDEGRSFLRASRPPRAGDTVAVLYPQLKTFLDGSIGFRVENNAHIAIIPHRLDTLLTANDALWGPRASICCAAGCATTENLKSCAKCHLVRYCGREHQAAEWPSHKEICKAASALRLFTSKNWTTYTHPFTFP